MTVDCKADGHRFDVAIYTNGQPRQVGCVDCGQQWLIEGATWWPPKLDAEQFLKYRALDPDVVRRVFGVPPEGHHPYGVES